MATNHKLEKNSYRLALLPQNVFICMNELLPHRRLQMAYYKILGKSFTKKSVSSAEVVNQR